MNTIADSSDYSEPRSPGKASADAGPAYCLSAVENVIEHSVCRTHSLLNYLTSVVQTSLYSLLHTVHIIY